MNEVQEKPRKKWYKKWSFIIVVLLLIASTVSFLVLSLMGPRIETCCHRGYYTIHDETRNAVAAYMADHNGSLPILNGTYTNANCSNCSVINISALLIENGGIMREVPNVTWEGPGASDDNCDSSGGHIGGCSESNHYIWIVDAYGYVYSYCTGDDCTTNNSGDQDIWP